MTKSAPAGVDLTALDTVGAANRGAELQLKHPLTQEPLDAFITILGRDSDTFQQAFRRKVNARAAREAITRKRGRDVEPPTLEDHEADALDLIVACTTGWRGLSQGSDPLDFSADAARTLYTSHPWIKAQVDAAMSDLAVFMKA